MLKLALIPRNVRELVTSFVLEYRALIVGSLQTESITLQPVVTSANDS